MSFLSGLFNTVVGFFTSNSIASTIAKVAISGYALRRLSQSLMPNESSANENIDGGVRLQIPPSSSNKIPVLYGNAIFGGIITDAELSNDNQTMYYVITLAEKTGVLRSTGNQSSYKFKDVYWNDQRIVFKSDGITVDYTVDRTGIIDRSPSGLIKVYCYAGNSTSGVIPENYTGTVPAAYSVMPSWTSSHSMTNLIFAVVQITYNRDKGIVSLGEFNFEVENTLKYPGDVLYDYFVNDLYGAGIDVSNIDTASLDALTVYSKTSVTYEDEVAGLGQVLDDRYQINGLLDTNENIFNNIEKICNSSASWLSFDNYNGKWGVIINRAETSVAHFDNSNIIGNIRIQGTGLSELYNNVKVEFPNRDIRDRADYVNIEIPVVDRNPNELTNVLNISYELINEPIQAQLLGFIELKQSRVDLLVEFNTDFSYMNLRAGEVISITNEVTGWNNKNFRIISITENQSDEQSLSLNILALEYDSNVYSTADLYRYLRTDNNGIITISSIGVPGTPQVSKIERDSRPRIIIESTSPSGVVEGMEFWYSEDINEPNDDNRSYTLLGTKRPAGGGTFSSGSTVVLTVDNLDAADFYVKTRGFNDLTTGPYSNVSGLVEFEPEQITDAIGPNTIAIDGLGGLVTALTVLSLLSKLDGLFAKVTGEESLFSKIFEAFEDVTGVDIIQNAKDGNLGPGTEPPEPPPAITLKPGGFMPKSDGTSFDSGTSIDSQWETTGSLYISYGSDVYTGPLIPGSGSFYLYRTDGSLIESKSIGSCTITGNVVEIPFGDRQPGTDYYVTADKGIVVTCSAKPIVAEELKAPQDTEFANSDADPNIEFLGYWRFNTARSYATARPIVPLTGVPTDIGPQLINKQYLDYTGGVTSNTNQIGVQSDIRLTFSQNVYPGTGSITVGSQSLDVTKKGLAVQFIGDKVILNPPQDLPQGQTITVTIPSGAISGYCVPYSGTSFSFTVDSGPQQTGSVNNFGNSDFEMEFDRPSTPAQGTFSVLDSSGNVVGSATGASSAINMADED